jgi:hypothetical protein
MHLNVWDTARTLRQLALGEIAIHCAQRSWPELRGNRATLEATLVTALNARVAPWGLSIERVHLTDLVITRGHRHYVDGMEKAS